MVGCMGNHGWKVWQPIVSPEEKPQTPPIVTERDHAHTGSSVSSSILAGENTSGTLATDSKGIRLEKSSLFHDDRVIDDLRRISARRGRLLVLDEGDMIICALPKSGLVLCMDAITSNVLWIKDVGSSTSISYLGITSLHLIIAYDDESVLTMDTTWSCGSSSASNILLPATMTDQPVRMEVRCMSVFSSLGTTSNVTHLPFPRHVMQKLAAEEMSGRVFRIQCPSSLIVSVSNFDIRLDLSRVCDGAFVVLISSLALLGVPSIRRGELF
jgi:hypothetical protein